MAIIGDNKIASVILTVKLNFELPLWQAIKLRIAGQNFKFVTDEIIKHLKDNVKEEK